MTNFDTAVMTGVMNLDTAPNNNIKSNLEVAESVSVSKPGQIKDDESQEYCDKLPPGKRKQIFILFLLSTLFLNYDTGVIPASLLEILKEIPLDYREQALIGSLVYLGLSFASLFVSILFNKFGPAKVNAYMLILNSICCFVFSFSTNKMILYSTRFAMGISEAFIVIYAPVWVNNYSPPNKSATWMGILHSFAAIGVISGYLCAGLSINFLSEFLSWRFSIRIQGIAEIPLALFFYFENEEYINVNLSKIEVNSDNLPHLNIDKDRPPNTTNERNIIKELRKSPSDLLRSTVEKKRISDLGNMINSARSRSKSVFLNKLDSNRIDTIEMNNLKAYCLQAKDVITNTLYISVTLALCSMYFIVTGIQFWMTSYLIDILGNDPIIVLLTFSVCSISAPLLGVLVGGTFADRYGGYKGKASLKALKLCSAFGVISFVFAFPIGFLYSMTYITVLLWTFLFFGAAIIPVGTGIMVSSVRRDCQATSSSLSQLIFNFFGYFLSPILTGIVMDSFKDKAEGYKWGIRLIFWWSIFACFFMSLAWIVAYNKYKDNQENDNKDLIEDMNSNMVELMKLEVMRRMAQGSSAF